MTWIAVAIVGSAALGAYSSNRASSAQAGAIGDAAQVQAQSAQDAAAVQKQMFDKQVELQAPFREAGLAGQNRLMDLLGLSGKTNAAGYGSEVGKFSDTPFTADPSYQWRLSQGQQALERSASARGGLFSGRAGKDMTDYAQGAASQEYGNAYNRFQIDRASRLNPLQALAGQAQSGANTLGSAAQNYGNAAASNFTNAGNNQANALMSAGNANASGYMGTANALSGGVGQYLNYTQNQNMMNRFFPTGGSSTVYPSFDVSSVQG